MPRKTQMRETRLVAEYLLEHYSKFPTKQAVPLGKIEDSLLASEGYQKAIGISRPYRPEVDAIVILPNYLVLVEAKIMNIVAGLAKLPLYKSLVPFTPELKQYQPREILMELVVGWTNDNLAIMARDAGVTVRVYCPPWMTDYVNSMQLYWTAEATRARQQKQQMREILGLE